jgi:hypothetical protein
MDFIGFCFLRVGGVVVGVVRRRVDDGDEGVSSAAAAVRFLLF